MAYEPFLFCAHRSGFRTVPHFCIALYCTPHRSTGRQEVKKHLGFFFPPISFRFFQQHLLAAVSQHCNSTLSY